MEVSCPHCKTKYEVTSKELYRYSKCEVCGMGFVVGATTSLLTNDTCVEGDRAESNEMPNHKVAKHTNEIQYNSRVIGNKKYIAVISCAVVVIFIFVAVVHNIRKGTVESKGKDVGIHVVNMEKKVPIENTDNEKQITRDSKIRDIAGYILGQEANVPVKVNIRDPKPDFMRVRLANKVGVFSGFYATLLYTPKTKRLACIILENPNEDYIGDAGKRKVFELLSEHCRFRISDRESNVCAYATSIDPPGRSDVAIQHPYGQLCKGVLYGCISHNNVFTDDSKYSILIMDKELMGKYEVEMDELQDEAIEEQKIKSFGKTLESFAGIKFGMHENDCIGGSEFIWEGKNVDFVLCAKQYGNKYRQFSTSMEVSYVKGDNRVFLVSLMYSGDMANFGIDYDGNLSREAEIVARDLTMKYGAPFILRDGSRYRIRYRYRSPSRHYLFPVGNTSIYLSVGEKRLECLHDELCSAAISGMRKRILDKRAKWEATRREADYDKFTAKDFLGLRFGQRSPEEPSGNIDRYGMGQRSNATGLIRITIAQSLFRSNTSTPDNYAKYKSSLWPVTKCRGSRGIECYVTFISSRIAAISARFDALNDDSTAEEFNVLCEMVGRKLGTSPRMTYRNNKPLSAEFSSGTIRVKITIDIDDRGNILFVAEDTEMKKEAIREMHEWLEKYDKKLPGVDML